MSTDYKLSAMEQLGSRSMGDLKMGKPPGGTPPQPDAAMQRRLTQLRTAMGDTTPSETRPEPAIATDAIPSESVPGSKTTSWTLPALWLLGLGCLAAAWTLRPQAVPDMTPAAGPMVSAPAAVANEPTPASAAVAEATPSVAVINPITAEPAVADAKPVLMSTDEQVRRTVEAWREDWARRDMMAYLDHYSGAFTPADGVSRRDWIASRYRNVGGRQSIEVQIQALKVEALTEDRARVSFLQDYASGSYRENAQPKTLDLVREANDRWRIVGEWQGDPPPLDEASKS